MAGLLLCSWVSAGFGQHPITIDRVNVGFSSTRIAATEGDVQEQVHLFKPAAWSPVWIELTIDPGLGVKQLEIIVEMADSDDILARSRIYAKTKAGEHRLMLNQPGQISYVKPGGFVSDILVHVLDRDSGAPLARSWQQKVTGIHPARYLYVTAGSALPGFQFQKKDSNDAAPLHGGDRLALGWVETGQVFHAHELPDRWIGYQALDLLILTTTNQAFWQELAADEIRQNALIEWVGHGGAILCSVGEHADHISLCPRIEKLLPARITHRDRTINRLSFVLPNSPRTVLLSPNRAIHAPVLEMLTQRPYQIHLEADERDHPLPYVVQASHGLGRITLVGFDLEIPPLAEWDQRGRWWEWLVNIASSPMPNSSERTPFESRATEGDDIYLERLHDNLDFYEGIPVVSFGWVALLILCYIVTVGPIEYYLLKKLLKRMEWTWVTLPIIVVSVSVLSYITAGELKGNELRINKIDLVDCDLATNQVIGESWFSIFSPRIQNLNLAVLPSLASDSDPQNQAWCITPLEDPRTRVNLSWHGIAKGNRLNLFRRRYDYAISASAQPGQLPPYSYGLKEVPMQIWSTKMFVARWSLPIDPAQPMFRSTLHVADGDANQLTGSITSFLPFKIVPGAQLIYRDRILPLPPLEYASPRFVATHNQLIQASSWLQNTIIQKDLLPFGNASRLIHSNDNNPSFRLWSILFHEAIAGRFSPTYHSSVRTLDQTWRAHEKNPYEAILIVRIPPVLDDADTLNSSAKSPTRLWLGQLPESGQERPRLNGRLRQETYVRIYIPVSPSLDP